MVGASPMISKLPLLAPLGAFAIALGDGFIYGSTVKYIDTAIPREHNLAALSF